MKDTDAQTVQAAARALGNIGTLPAALALEEMLPAATGGSQAAICEGLLRCAEALTSGGQMAASSEIYDRLRGLPQLAAPIRAAALRGAILARGKAAAPLLAEAIRGSNKALADAAIRAAMELPCAEITDALVAELPKASAERQRLLILVLADRHEPRVMQAVLQAAQSGDGQLRALALRALTRMGDASCVPLLLDAAVDGGHDVSQAAIEALERLRDKAIDDQLTARLAQAQGKARIILIDLVRRRHAAAAVSLLWLAADDKDAAVRAAGLAALGGAIETADLPKLIARLASAKDPQEAAALDKALREACLRAADREAVAARLAEALPSADGPVKTSILQTLNAVGGTRALEAVAASARAGDAELRSAAFRVLGQWKSVDAAPVLLDLYRAAGDKTLKPGAIRAYIRFARQFDMSADRRAAMCRTALQIAERDDDKRLVLEVVLRYPSDTTRAIALEASNVPALKDEALLVVAAVASGKSIDRAELGRALAQGSHKPVKLEIIKAFFGAGTQTKDVTAILRRYAKNYRVIFLPGESYNESFQGDPAPGTVKQLKIRYRIDGKEGDISLNENATILLPLPR